MDDYESVLLVKPEVFVYRIPPRTTTRGYRAADWNLGSPDWTGRMRVVVKNKKCVLKLEDKMSGELFAQSPIDKYPGIAVEAVTDSSRYFVLRIEDDGGKAAFIGLGFGDRSDSFDLNVALQDHFKYVKKEEDAEKEKDEEPSKPALDLGFKEGETIKINMKITKKDGQDGNSALKPKIRSGGSGFGILPPPPGGIKIPPPSPQRNISANLDLLGGQVPAPPTAQSSSDAPSSGGNESWGGFVSANPPSDSANATKGGGGAGWVTF
ncbi:UNVERIFIED_CONTAM: hypothetical protein RMT77_004799 [Armadillidium vulgare]